MRPLAGVDIIPILYIAALKLLCHPTTFPGRASSEQLLVARNLAPQAPERRPPIETCSNSSLILRLHCVVLVFMDPTTSRI